jgi:hypothetical protein
MKATELERMKATELESMKAIELDRLSVLLKWRAFGLPSAGMAVMHNNKSL